MYKLEIKRFFDAAHRLNDGPDLVTKACARLHGHSYLCAVTFQSNKADRNGMVVDFKAIKNIIDIFDHQFVNEIFLQNNIHEEATAENIAKFIWDKISIQYPDLESLKVSICEGYKGPDNSSWASYEVI